MSCTRTCICTCTNGLAIKKYYDKMYQITKLIFEQDFNEPILIAPNVLVLIFGRFFNQEIGIIPRYIVELRFGEKYNCLVGLLPGSLKCLIFGNNYILTLILSKNIERLTIGYGFNCDETFKLTKKLLHIIFECNVKIPIKFSKHLTTLLVYTYCNQIIKLPKYITFLKIGFSSIKSINFTSRMIYIELYLNSRNQMKHLIFEHPYKAIHLKNVSFCNWDLSDLTDNPKKIILHCLSYGNTANEPRNAIIDLIK